MAVETSIVIRTLNEAKHLGDLMQGIHSQNYRDWEIILVDSGSTDGTLEIAEKYGAHIYHIPSHEFTFGRSLNLGCSKANGDYLVFASGHVWPITNNWLRNLVMPFGEPSVAMVYGRQRPTDANRLSEQRDLYNTFGETSTILVDEPKGNNGNAAIRRELWQNQPFDESLPGFEDIDWARKSQRKGYRVYYAADAAVHHVHEETLRQVYRRYYREAKAANHMFPHYRFSKWDLVRGLPYFIARDVLFALKRRKFLQIFQVPGTRVAYFWGHYNGVNRRRGLDREYLSKLSAPQTRSQVVVAGPGAHSLIATELPPVRPEEVLVQVAFVPVEERDSGLAEGEPGGDSGHSYPFVPGSAFSGVVVKAGKRARNVRKGARVIGVTHPEFGISGVENSPAAGAYSDYVVVQSGDFGVLPPNVSLLQGALVEHLSLCHSAISQLSADSGKRACVIGAGALGNLCSQLLRSRGLKVTIVDGDTKKLALLHKYDVDTLTKLDGLDDFDYIFDAGGDVENLKTINENAGSQAKVIHVGISGPAGHSNERHKRDWLTAMNTLSKGKVILEDHITSIHSLPEYASAWDSMNDHGHLQSLLCANDGLRML